VAFSETVTRSVKRRAHFQCCLCKALGVEVHHIIPQSENGPDSESNAAPLCPSCHETYGANQTKRKFIREARDLWYEICDQRYASEGSLLQDVYSAVSNSASKDDISQLRSEIAQVLRTFGPASRTSNVTVPRKASGAGTTRVLDARDLLVLVIGTASDRPVSQTGVLCLKELWPIKGGYRNTYNDFKQRFGERVLMCFASRALDDAEVEVDTGVTEPEVDQSMPTLYVEAACLLLLDDGKIEAVLQESGQLIWRAAGVSQGA
jgi:hypothetical protein